MISKCPLTTHSDIEREYKLYEKRMAMCKKQNRERQNRERQRQNKQRQNRQNRENQKLKNKIKNNIKSLFDNIHIPKFLSNIFQ